MKKRICFASLFMVIILLFSLSTTAFAADYESSTTDNHEEIELFIANEVLTKEPDGGVSVSFDLVKEVSTPNGENVVPTSFGWVEIVGYGQMRCRLYPDNGVGYFDWNIYLENGAQIKKVTGTIVLERKSAVLPDLNSANKKVSESYSPLPPYEHASGTEDFKLDREIDRDMNVRFKWTGFKVQGVKDVYVLTNGSATGTIADFSI